MEFIEKIYFVLRNIVMQNTAIVIALLALTVSIFESIRRRKHDKLSVRPWLLLEFNISDRKQTGLFLKNNGVGPAIITKVEIIYKGEPIKNEKTKSPWKAIREKFDFPKGRYICFRIPTPYWLPPKESLRLFVIDCSTNMNDIGLAREIKAQEINSFIEKTSYLKVIIKYQSCYARNLGFTEKYYSEYLGCNAE